MDLRAMKFAGSDAVAHAGLRERSLKFPPGRAPCPHARDGEWVATGLRYLTSISLPNTPMAEGMVWTLNVSGVSGSHRGQSPTPD